MDMDLDMSTGGYLEPPSLTVIQKAANVCTYCRVRKQKCDRLLPSCARCASKQRLCDYTPPLNLQHQSSHESDALIPLFANIGPCSPDLTHRGRSELLQSTYALVAQHPGAMTHFTDLVSEIQDLADMTAYALLEEYARCMHRWIPLLSPDQVYVDYANGVLRQDQALPPLVLLTTFLMVKRPCGHAEHIKQDVLYTTIKQMLAILQTSSEVSAELVQATLLVAAYECAQGMLRQAHLTLSATAGIVNLLRVERQTASKETDKEIVRLSVAVLVLDRLIALFALDHSMPLVCPTSHSLTQFVQATLLSYPIPPVSTDPVRKIARKLQVQAQVVVATGRALEYVLSERQGLKISNDYDVINADMVAVQRSLVEKQHGHSWLMCDCIAMGFATLTILHQTHFHRTSDSGAEIALRSSQRMAWEMNVLLIEKLQAEPNISILPFGGLACVLRAAVAVADTPIHESVSLQELTGLLPGFRRFAERWMVGGDFLRRYERAAEPNPDMT